MKCRFFPCGAGGREKHTQPLLQFIYKPPTHREVSDEGEFRRRICLSWWDRLAVTHQSRTFARMRGRVFGFVVLAYAVAVAYAGDQHPAAARQQALKLDGVRFSLFSCDSCSRQGAEILLSIALRSSAWASRLPRALWMPIACRLQADAPQA